MIGTAIAKRYAEGFLEYAKPSIGMEKAIGDLKAARNILRENPKLLQLLEGPVVTLTEKHRIVNDVFCDGFSEEIRNFLKILLAKSRLVDLNDIAEYARLKYSHGEEVDAILKITYPLDIDIMEEIKEKLEKKLDKKLHMYVKIEPELLGGVSATIGNTVIDGSMKKRIEGLKEKMLAAKVE